MDNLRLLGDCAMFYCSFITYHYFNNNNLDKTIPILEDLLPNFKPLIKDQKKENNQLIEKALIELTIDSLELSKIVNNEEHDNLIQLLKTYKKIYNANKY